MKRDDEGEMNGSTRHGRAAFIHQRIDLSDETRMKMSLSRSDQSADGVQSGRYLLGASVDAAQGLTILVDVAVDNGQAVVVVVVATGVVELIEE